MFKSTYNRGFQMTFKNGLTISVQFGTGNYCERRNIKTSYRGDMDAATPVIASENAEIAIWNTEQVWFDFGTDQVRGWVTADEVAHWIYLTEAAIHLDHLKNMAIDWKMVEARTSEV